MNRYTIYGTPRCKYCDNAKKELEVRGLEYDYLDITDQALRAELDSKLSAPARSVPQVFIDNAHIGGYAELIKHLY